MSVVTKEFLESIDISMDEETFGTFNTHFSDTLYQHIVDRVVAELTPDQMNEFMQLQDSDNDTVWEWIKTNVPRLNDIISQEVNALLSEIVQNSDQINEPTS